MKFLGQKSHHSCTPWPHNFWQTSRNRIFVYGMVGIGPGPPRVGHDTEEQSEYLKSIPITRDNKPAGRKGFEFHVLLVPKLLFFFFSIIYIYFRSVPKINHIGKPNVWRFKCFLSLQSPPWSFLDIFDLMQFHDDQWFLHVIVCWMQMQIWFGTSMVRFFDMVSYTYTVWFHIGHDTFVYKIAVCIYIYRYKYIDINCKFDICTRTQLSEWFL